MNPESIFYTLDSDIQEDMMSKVPDNCTDPNILSEAFIQYLTSRSHLNKTYDNLAYQLSIEHHHKNTCESFVETMHKLQKNMDVTGRMKPLLQEEFYSFITENSDDIENVYQDAKHNSTEFPMTFFGWKTLFRSYLIQTHQGVVERLDHLWFRIALFLHTNNYEKVKQSFIMLRSGEAIHATPTLFHAGMVHAQMASCFDGETLVNTLRGPIPIKDVQLGDEVVTHLGRVKKVIQTHKNKLGDRKMYEVDIIKTNKFLVTEDHHLYVYNKESKIMDWKAVKDLTCKDYVMIPKYHGTKVETTSFIDVNQVVSTFDYPNYKNAMDIVFCENGKKIFMQTTSTHNNFNSNPVHFIHNSTPIYSKITIDSTYMKFLGIWLGDGHIIYKNSTIRGIGITIHKDNLEMIDFCKNSKDIFGIEHLTIHKMKNQNVIQVLFNSPILGILFHQLYGKGFNNKHLPDNIAKLNTSLLLELISGLVSTDGCVAENGGISLCMANKGLMDQIYSICRLHNLDVGRVGKASRTKFTKHQAYVMSLTNLRYDLTGIWKIYDDDRVNCLKYPTSVKNQYSPLTIDGFKFLAYKSRKLIEYKENFVYTLGVEDDHSYSIEGIIAQNCFLIGTEDSVQGIFKTVSDAAVISKHAGGIGIHISNIRGQKSYIYGTNGYSNGIMPMLRVYNDTSRYIDQCFEGQTRIVTSRGLIPISDIKPYEDTVLTKDGKFHKVLKKLVHVVDTHMIRVGIQTPWKEKTKCLMTSKHDMYWYNPVTNEKEFLSIEKAGYGFQPVYIQPETQDIPFYEEECFALGYLYANLSYYQPMTWVVAPPNDPTLVQRITNFLERYYPKTFYLKPKPNNCERMDIFLDMKKFESTLPSVIDFHALTPGDFPVEFALGPMNKIKKFLEGYKYSKQEFKESPKVQLLNYRLGCFENKAKILSIESKDEHTKHILYDLVVDQEHNYQTLIGLAHNGGGKRKGAFAMYIEPWHADIFDFIFARRNTGSEEERARDLFFGLWVPDEFMRRVESDDDWYLMSENLSPGLSKVWGKEFEELYHSYISQEKYTKKIKARELWYEILKSQIETGTPYILYKDTCNRFSNQQNLGTIQSSNLCCEIIEYSDSKEYAVCNLASICLSSCLKEKSVEGLDFWIFGKEGCFYCDLLKSLLNKHEHAISYTYKSNKEHLTSLESSRLVGKTSYPIVYKGNVCIGGFKEIWEIYLRPEFDFEKLGDIVGTLVENLNIIIDKNAYPLEECRRSNFRNRPVGIGVQGLADVFMALLEPYDSEYSRTLNRKIFETMYYYALKKSHELALIHGSYESFQGSPLSKGKFHFEFLSVFEAEKHLSCGYDWESLRTNIVKDGTRNSLLLAPMPTASTSQIMGNTESFEPLTSNFYVRRTLAGEFYIMNKHLRTILEYANAWKEHNIQALILDKGSIMNTTIPKGIKDVFKTVWEIPQKHLIEMAADRQMFIDQSQSFNIYMSKGDPAVLTKIHFYGWKKELKTGSYYLRTRAAISSQNFSMDPEKEACVSCSS
jgi:ribonucleoside-diphosphate reductase alpha subunit